MRRGRFPVLLALAAAIVGGADDRSRAETAPFVGARRVLSGAVPQGLRVFARPGDLRLDNHEVTAVVRASDGALVDFLRLGSVLPTSDALGATTRIDGVWELVPVVLVDGRPAPRLAAARVEPLDDRVRVTGVVELAAAPIGVELDYALDPRRARLELTARFRSAAALPASLEAGLELRFGNTAYYVSGSPAPQTSFEGLVRWVGRRGAGGDLLLRALEPGVFAARFVTAERGFVPALRALQPLPRPTARELVARFELSYEPLPLPPPAAAQPTGTLALDVRDERGRPLACKLGLTRAGQSQPVFPDFGGLDGTDRFVWTGNGRLERELPAGSYELLVSAGPERELHRASVELAVGERVQRALVLRRVVPTPGWIAADLHLHQAPSVDADLSLEARLIAVAAEGVELAVASDHYVVTDFAPVVDALVRSGVLSRPLVTVAGSEVSTVGERFGHFNVFPLAADAPAIEYENTTPAELFASARRASPGGLLQVNHPRHDPRLGYFIAYDFDPSSGTARRPGFDASFDAIEVFNGFHVQDHGFTERLLRDYLSLLGSGRRYVATGSSDSHQLAFLDPGLPRTLIAHGGTSDDADVQVPAARALDALKAGRAIVTSGPMIEASVAGAGPGETAHHVGKQAWLRVRVRAAPWVSTRTLSVLEGSSGKVVHRTTIEPGERVLRFDRALPIAVAAPTFVVVVVAGDAALPNTSRKDVLPFAFTNAIWLEP